MFLGLLQARASCWLANRASHGVASLSVLYPSTGRLPPPSARLLSSSSMSMSDSEPPPPQQQDGDSAPKRQLIGQLTEEFDEISDGSDDERLLAEDDAALRMRYPTLDSDDLGDLSDDEAPAAAVELSRNEQAAVDMTDLWKPRQISGLGERDIRFVDADPQGEGPLLDAIVGQLDEEGRREFARRVRVGSLHKEGEQPEAADDGPAEPVWPDDLDTAEERTLKEEFARQSVAVLRPLLRQRGTSEELDIEIDSAALESESESESDAEPRRSGDNEVVYGTESDSDDGGFEPAEPLVFGDIRRIEQRLHSEDDAKQATARRILGDRPDEAVFTVERGEAEEYFGQRAARKLENRTPLAGLKYTKLYPATPRRWVENLKTPPGWFDPDTGHWQGVEFGDDHEYAEYWKATLPMIAAEREAAIKRDSPKGLKVVPPADTEGHYRFGITQQEVDSIAGISKKVMAAISFKEAPQREINQFRKQRAIEKWSYKPGDTGSTPVQIAILTERINYLSDHLTRNPKDKHSGYGFQRIRNRRKALLRYLKKKDTPTFMKVLRELNIRDV